MASAYLLLRPFNLFEIVRHWFTMCATVRSYSNLVKMWRYKWMLFSSCYPWCLLTFATSTWMTLNARRYDVVKWTGTEWNDIFLLYAQFYCSWWSCPFALGLHVRCLIPWGVCSLFQNRLSERKLDKVKIRWNAMNSFFWNTIKPNEIRSMIFTFHFYESSMREYARKAAKNIFLHKSLPDTFWDFNIL